MYINLSLLSVTLTLEEGLGIEESVSAKCLYKIFFFTSNVC